VLTVTCSNFHNIPAKLSRSAKQHPSNSAHLMRPVGTHPHLLVVGVDNPMAVPCLARLGASRDGNRRLRLADQHMSGSLNTKGFYKCCMYAGVKTSRSASPIFLFVARYSSNSLLSTGGTCISGAFGGEEGTADLGWQRALELVADIREAALGKGVCWQSTIHVSLDFSMGARREATQAGGGSQPEERQGLVAGVFGIDSHLKRTGTEGFRINISTPNIFCGAATRTPPPVGTKLSIGRLRRYA
jgi:hypothetical protein